MSATPRPWADDPASLPTDGNFRLFHYPPGQARRHGMFIADIRRRDDLDLIVIAVNSHDELVAALSAMLESYFDYHDSHSLTEPVTGRAGNAADQAIAVLARVRGLSA